MKHGLLAGALVAAVALAASPVHAQRSQQQQQGASAAKGGSALGTVTLNRKLMADGQPLTAGTYQVRLSDERPAPAVGESPDSERYVEFMRGGKVVAKALATVVSNADIGPIAKGPKPPTNGSRVDMLKGNDYVRVWINRGGENYLIHMTPGA
jgi:hypothetical protein